MKMVRFSYSPRASEPGKFEHVPGVTANFEANRLNTTPGILKLQRNAHFA